MKYRGARMVTTTATLKFRVEWDGNKDSYKFALAKELRKMADIIEEVPPYDKKGSE